MATVALDAKVIREEKRQRRGTTPLLKSSLLHANLVGLYPISLEVAELVQAATYDLLSIGFYLVLYRIR